MRLAILGSTRGSNLEPILTAINNGQLPAEVVVVASNKPDAGILQRAQGHHLPHIAVPAAPNESRECYDQRLHTILSTYHPDLIVMIGYMRIVSAWFVQQWPNRIINVHPSLLPKHAGLMDLAVHQAVLDAGESETGCTVHYVNEIVDGGDVLAQRTCPVDGNDTAQTLKAKVQQLEGIALVEAIKHLLE